MQVDKFSTKLNKIDNHVYMIEEEVFISDGVYEGTLEHDNVKTQTVNVYTEKKLTGEKLENILLSTPSETPWKTIIKIFAKEGITKAYISYQTTGDTVEADDINFLQDSIVKTQEELNSYEEKTNEEILNIKNKANSLEENKVDKVQGKQLSTNDYTNEEKNKLSGIEENANNYVHPINHDDRYYTEAESDSRYLRTNVRNIGASDDFNDIVDFGIYRVASNSAIINAPYSSSIYGNLEVIQFNSTFELIQRFTDGLNDQYIRFKNNANGGTWLPWSKVFTSTNKPTASDVGASPIGHTHDDIYYTESESRNLFVSKNPTRLDGSTDLNKITTGGNYIVASNGIVNSPKPYGRLVVLQWDTNSKWITQIFYGDLNNEMYTRCTLNDLATSWSAWSKIYSEINPPTIPTKFSQLENDIGLGGLPAKFTWSMLRGY